VENGLVRSGHVTNSSSDILDISELTIIEQGKILRIIVNVSLNPGESFDLTNMFVLGYSYEGAIQNIVSWSAFSDRVHNSDFSICINEDSLGRSCIYR
jgi:hypothetical protein